MKTGPQHAIKRRYLLAPGEAPEVPVTTFDDIVDLTLGVAPVELAAPSIRDAEPPAPRPATAHRDLARRAREFIEMRRSGAFR